MITRFWKVNQQTNKSAFRRRASYLKHPWMEVTARTKLNSSSKSTRFNQILFRILLVACAACVTWALKGTDKSFLNWSWKSSVNPVDRREVSYKDLVRVTGWESVEARVPSCRLTCARHLVKRRQETTYWRSIGLEVALLVLYKIELEGMTATRMMDWYGKPSIRVILL